MKKRKKTAGPKMGPTLDYAAPRYAAAAVLEVFRENQKTRVFSGFKSTSPWWCRNSEMRADLLKRTRLAWCRIVHKDFTWFPFSEDFVVRLYARVSRALPSSRRAWRAEVTPKKQGER